MGSTIETSTWQPQANDGEYSLSGADTIIDASANTIVDSSANSLVTIDTAFTLMDATAWSSNDGS